MEVGANFIILDVDVDSNVDILRFRKIRALKKEKCEVKTERDWWYKTGNIAIEIECYGKPSGLMTTESDIWIHVLATGDTDYCKLVFDVPKLKQIVEKFKDRTKMVGDYKAAKCVLIPLSELFITNGKEK